VGALDGSEREATWVDQWNERARFDESRRLRENLAMVSATLPGKKRPQRENAGIGGALEREGSKPVVAPTEAAHHVAGATHRLERCVERGATCCVVDDVEPVSASQPRDIVCDGPRPIDKVCPKALRPTPPDPPCTKTDWPARTRARSIRPSHAVINISGSAAASRIVTFAGLSASRSAST
jgi:hypothetical protein